MVKTLMKLLPSRVLSLQARKPSGLIGRYMMTEIFGQGNHDLNQFTLEKMELESNSYVLEVGFGPGRLVHEIAKITTDGMVEGVDFSNAMLKAAKKLNQQFIAEEKVRLHRVDCTALDYETGMFDRVSSVNTLYFWVEPERVLAEIYRVLKPGGKVVIGFRDEVQMGSLDLSDDVFAIYTKDEVVKLLESVGFQEVQVVGQEGRPFYSYCAVGWKRNSCCQSSGPINVM